MESLIIKKNEKVKEIKVDGIFVEIGAVPFVKFAKI